MKKYLDIKTTGISSQQSTSNLRSNLNMKPNVKPSTSTSASTSTLARNPGHTRTASNSTASQIRNLATSLTRVSRKEPTTTAPTPYIPVRSVPTSKVASESKEKPTTTRPGSIQELKGPVLPLRSHPSAVSRPTTVAPHRLPLTSGVNPTPAVSGPQSSASSGPRRVPMPPPAPAPTKEKPAVTLKRPTSRVDTAPSGQRPTVSAVPPKKPVVTIASSLQDRGPTTTKTSVRPNKSTTTAGPSGSTKPLVITNKPVWGQSAPASKVAPTASQRTAVPLSKTLTKRPPARQVSATTSGASKTRPTTPALIALPPSPIPEDNTDMDKIPATQEPNKGLDQNADQRLRDETHSARQSPIPSIEATKVDEKKQRVQGQEPQSPISSETIANSTLVNGHISLDSNPLATTSTDGVKIDDEQQEQEPEGESPIPSETLETPTLVNNPRDLENHSNSLAMGAKVEDGQQEVQEQEPVASPISSETIANPAFVNAHSDFEGHSNLSAKTTDECPITPQGALPNPVNTNTAILAAKTPISALLSSIQRGFLYSPSSPLSPADSYLLPGPHGMTANKDRSDIPVQPFNFALHPPSNHTFGNSMAEMALGDIGVIRVADHKLFPSSTLMPDDGPRHAFVDINK